MTVNTTDEYTPEEFTHGNSPSPTQTASGQGLLSNQRIITQADPPAHAQHLNAFPSQESTSENAMTYLHLLADVALEHVKGFYTNKAKPSNGKAASLRTSTATPEGIFFLRYLQSQLRKERHSRKTQAFTHSLSNQRQYYTG